VYSLDDTIAAISTPLGQGGIGIVRLTGPEAAAILRQIFVPATGTGSTADECALFSHHLHYGHVVEPESGEQVDEVLAAFMRAPRTYTRQDVVEINGHGGIVPLRRILALCLRLGVRPAEPGEFTARAYLNGRLDLAQAEAVIDVVRARTDKALQAAVNQLAGRLSDSVRSVRHLLVNVLAYLEASIDFVEDEIPERSIGSDLEAASEELSQLLAEADQGMIYRQGVRAAIVGRPNVGKSSLLNQLLRASRAIVTDIPGTTRDTLEETLNLQGVPVVLVDTAGITAATRDPIERLGIERSRRAVEQADLVLLVLDASQSATDADRAIAALIGNKPSITVLNKRDLVPASPGAEFAAFGEPSVALSALTGDGLAELENAILDTVFSGRVTGSRAPAVTNPRHRTALSQALAHVQSAVAADSVGLSADLIAVDVAGAVNTLGEITGQTASEDLLDTIFGDFCIGK
jgi:tRNA modification GTPase